MKLGSSEARATAGDGQGNIPINFEVGPQPYLERDIGVTVHWREVADAVVDRDAARERDALLHLLVLLERLKKYLRNEMHAERH